MGDSQQDEAFVTLLTEHQKAIRLYIRSLLPGDSNANDVAQQANTTLWKKRDSFELGTNFKAWAFSVARYEVLNYRKKQARDALVFTEELEEILAEEMTERLDQVEQKHEALRHCLEKLRPVDKALILNRYFQKATLRDYAEQVGRSEGSLRVTLHRLRSALQGCIENQLRQEGVSS